MKNTRLLHLIKTLDVGGVERSTINVSNQLADRIEFVGIFARKGIFDHTNIVDTKSDYLFRWRCVFSILYIINLFTIIKIIVCNKINIINYHQRIYVLYIHIIRIIFPSVKIIYSHHNIFNDYLNKFLKADTFIAFSKASKQDLLNADKKPIVLLHHSIEIPIRINVLNENVNVIGFVGRFEKHKGIYLLIETFLSYRKINNDLRLMLVGEGKEKYRILKYINVNSLQNNILVRKQEIYLEDIYKDIDCLVVPSQRHEGFGLVIIEAMAYKIPVIASDLEPFKELIQHDFNGLLFERNNINSLKTQMQRIINEKELRERLAENGFTFVSKNYALKNLY
jgi:glycosyltransferase involved in cell wall biosynthesis